MVIAHGGSTPVIGMKWSPAPVVIIPLGDVATTYGLTKTAKRLSTWNVFVVELPRS